MAPSPQSEAAKSEGEAGNPPPNQPFGRTQMRTNYVALIGIACLTVFLAWKQNDKFEAIRRLWPASSVTQGISLEHVPGWHDHEVDITFLTSAVEIGAVCLDGSPPAYYFSKGSGDGVNNWIIFMEGGGACDSIDSCLSRSFQGLGSSNYMPRTTHFNGILSGSPIISPDFHDWNRVFVKYCDGSTYYSDVADPVDVGTGSGRLFFRGRRIWSSVINDLLSKGMDKANNAFLTGCSAGGMATVLHCDRFRDLLPNPTTVVKCLSDGGFIINVPDVYGEPTIERFASRIARTHYLPDSLPEWSHFKLNDKELCLFAEYQIADVKPPLFVLNSAYDNWQVANSLFPKSSDKHGDWAQCRGNLSQCTEAQLNTVHAFRAEFLERLRPVLENAKDGVFIDSCYTHCQTKDDVHWNGIKVDGKSIATAVGDWYFERKPPSNVIDCPFPCNPTCPDGLIPFFVL